MRLWASEICIGGHDSQILIGNSAERSSTWNIRFGISRTSVEARSCARPAQRIGMRSRARPVQRQTCVYGPGVAAVATLWRAIAFRYANATKLAGTETRTR